DTAGLPIGEVDRNSGLTRCRRWQTTWITFKSGGTTCPPASQNGATAEALDAVLELRGCVEELQAVELPKGFGRTDGACRQTALAASRAVHISPCRFEGRPHK